MRTKRLDKFKKMRRKKLKNLILYCLVIPVTSVFFGYIVTNLFVLPEIVK